MSFISVLEKKFSFKADPVISEKQSAYMRHLFPFFGIPKPVRVLLEKPDVKAFEGNLEETLLELWSKPEREFQYAALTLVKHFKKKWDIHYFSLFEQLIRNRSWWDTVDDLASNCLGPLLFRFPSLVEQMDQWIDDPCLWIRRSALLFQLKWKMKTDTKRLFHYCLKRGDEKEFFIQKAIGWSLREYAKSDPKSVATFLQENKGRLSRLSEREAWKSQ